MEGGARWDAVVVGGRCAGAATAMLLARRGLRVLVVERATIPRDTLASHFIAPTGMAILERWGLRAGLREQRCTPITRFLVDLDRAGAFVVDLVRGSFRWGAFHAELGPAAGGAIAGYCPRRRDLDRALLEAAAAAGAEVRQRFAVGELVVEQGRVVGVHGQSGGRMIEERARIVVGADGLHSLVARRVNAPVYHRRASVTCAYNTYFAGVEIEGMEFYARPGRALMAMPTNDGLTLVSASWPSSEFGRIGADIEHEFADVLALAPDLASRVAAGTREAPFAGKAALPNLFRTPYGPGWALVGDAGYHRDPIVGQGITDAFQGAELLVDAIVAGLDDEREAAGAFAEYEARRNLTAAPMYALACRLATLEPPTVRTGLLFGAAFHGQHAAAPVRVGAT